MKQVKLLIISMRIHQWVKNVFIFAPVVFAQHLMQLQYLINSIVAFFLFSLVAGSIYVFNDCFDKKKDQIHPDKRKRPIASGELPVKHAILMASGVLLCALAVIYYFNVYFFIIALSYVGMNIVYSFYLKTVVILDVMIIAIGFVLRVQIGGVINTIQLSHWILIITFLLAIFLGLIKRRQEFLKMENLRSAKPNEDINNSHTLNDPVNNPGQTISATQPNPGNFETRTTLKKYNLPLLDQLISITTAITVVSYIVYVVNPDIQHKFNSKELFWTVPFVVFGVFRYLYLTYVKGKGENPAEIIFTDIPFTTSLFLWVLVFILLIIYKV